jgi:hypothetical protein
MRVREHHPNHLAAQLNRLVDVEFGREGMVRDGRSGSAYTDERERSSGKSLG